MNVPFFGLIVLRVQIFEASTVKAMQPARLATHYPSELSESKLHTSKKKQKKTPNVNQNSKRKNVFSKRFGFFLRKVSSCFFFKWLGCSAPFHLTHSINSGRCPMASGRGASQAAIASTLGARWRLWRLPWRRGEKERWHVSRFWFLVGRFFTNQNNKLLNQTKEQVSSVSLSVFVCASIWKTTWLGQALSLLPFFLHLRACPRFHGIFGVNRNLLSYVDCSNMFRVGLNFLTDQEENWSKLIKIGEFREDLAAEWLTAARCGFRMGRHVSLGFLSNAWQIEQITSHSNKWLPETESNLGVLSASPQCLCSWCLFWILFTIYLSCILLQRWFFFVSELGTIWSALELSLRTNCAADIQELNCSAAPGDTGRKDKTAAWRPPSQKLEGFYVLGTRRIDKKVWKKCDLFSSLIFDVYRCFFFAMFRHISFCFVWPISAKDMLFGSTNMEKCLDNLLWALVQNLAQFSSRFCLLAGQPTNLRTFQH